MKRLKDLIKVIELNLSDLLKVRGGYSSPVDDCGGSMCKDVSCTRSASASCTGTDCHTTTCSSQQCDNYA